MMKLYEVHTAFRRNNRSATEEYHRVYVLARNELSAAKKFRKCAARLERTFGFKFKEKFYVYGCYSTKIAETLREQIVYAEQDLSYALEHQNRHKFSYVKDAKSWLQKLRVSLASFENPIT